MKGAHALLLVFFQLAVVFAAPRTLQKPSQDPFYDFPDGYESAQPGDILKWRQTPAKIDSPYLPLHIKNAWQYMARTTDALNQPTIVTGTIMQPYNANQSRLLAYEPIEDAVSIDCSPSFAYLDGAGNETASTQSEMYLIQLALDQGWNVVIPDYEGPHSAYLASRLAGHATLDSIRAALSTTDKTEINADAATTMWGYSGGTVPVAWAAVMQPEYAPDLKKNLVGAAMGGTVTNVTNTAVLLDGNASAGQVAIALAGVSQQYPEFRQELYRQMNDSMEAKFNRTFDTCLDESHVIFENDHFFSGTPRYFEEGWAFLTNPIIREVLDNNTLALNKSNEIPEFPIFFYHGKKDITVGIETVDRVFDNWCSWTDTPIDGKHNTTTTLSSKGLSLEFAVNEGTDHYQEVKQGAPAAVAWLTDRYEGKPHVDGCSRVERKSNLFYPGVSRSVVEFVISAAKSLVGAKIGPNTVFDELADGIRDLPELSINL